LGEGRRKPAAHLLGNSPEDLRGNWALDREFSPHMSKEERERLYGRWNKAVKRCLEWEEPEAGSGATA